MADFYKVSYHMRFANLGWRYLFYSQSDSARSVVQAASSKRTKLLAVHHNSVRLHNITAANVETSKRDHYKLATDEDDIPPSNDAPDVTQTSALVTLRTAGTRSRKIWLRGLADIRVETDFEGFGKMHPSLGRKLNTWAREFVTLGYLMRYVEPPDPGTAFEWKDIVSLEEEPDSNGAFTIITCRVPHGLNAGDRVTFSFDKKELYLLGFRGEHTPVDVAVAQDDTKLVVPVTFRPKSTPFNPHRMRMRKAQYNYVALNGETDFITFRSRDTGRAPGPRGRDTGVSFR